MPRFSLVLMLFMTGFLFACADTPENPLVERNAGFVVNNPATTFAVTAERRLVVFNHNTRFYCAEGSPDAVQSLATLVKNSTGIDVTVPSKAIDVELQNNYLRALATSVAANSPRTQGIFFFRDAMFQLCLINMNRASCLSTGTGEGRCPDSVNYNKNLDRILDITEKLIMTELPKLHDPLTLLAPPNQNQSLSEPKPAETKPTDATKTPAPAKTTPAPG